MPVTLTSPVEGLKVGDTYSGEREDWLVANGYAARSGDFDGLHVSDVPAAKDPTLAVNREAAPAQGVDAYLQEDGEAVLEARDLAALDLEDDRLEVAPQARLVPAGLEKSSRTMHGNRDVTGAEYGEDKLTAKVNGSAKAAKAVEDNDVLDVAPQADARSRAELADEVDKDAEDVAKRSAKVRERAESEIPETSANVEQKKSRAKKDDDEK